jgi:hypothetical protein
VKKKKTPGAEGLVGGVHDQFDVVSERHSFASATDRPPLAAVLDATGFAGASAVGGFSAGVSTGGGVAGAAGTGAGSGAAVAAAGGGSSRGAGVSTFVDDGAVGLDGSRNPNHQVPNAMSSTAPIAIAVVGRLDGAETGDAVRVAAVGCRGGGAEATGGGTAGEGTGAGAGFGAVGSGANGSSSGTVSNSSNGLPIAAQKSLRFCPLV